MELSILKEENERMRVLLNQVCCYQCKKCEAKRFDVNNNNWNCDYKEVVCFSCVQSSQYIYTVYKKIKHLQDKNKKLKERSQRYEKMLPSVYDVCMFCREKCFAGEGGEIYSLCDKYVCQSCKKLLGAHFVCYKELEDEIFVFEG